MMTGLAGGTGKHSTVISPNYPKSRKEAIPLMRYIKSRANTGPPGAGEINHEADNRKDVRLQHKFKI